MQLCTKELHCAAVHKDHKVYMAGFHTALRSLRFGLNREELADPLLDTRSMMRVQTADVDDPSLNNPVVSGWITSD